MNHVNQKYKVYIFMFVLTQNMALAGVIAYILILGCKVASQ